MTPSAATPGAQRAGRFLHVCYCCSKDSLQPVARFFVEQFGFRHTMSTPEEVNDGAVLGLEGDFTSATAFVYDDRGPRTSPAIEIQSWVQPPLLGTPSSRPTDVGIQALGIAVADVEKTTAGLESAGCAVVARGNSPWGPRWATVRDMSGVALDLIEFGAGAATAPRLAHLRIGSTDLARSLEWYEGLGFELIQRVSIEDGEFLGISGPVRADAARMRLREEPFEVVLLDWEEPAPTGGRHPSQPNHAGLYRAALRVDDTRGCYEEMTEAGWKFDRAPMSVELHGTPVPDMWISFLSDPDGVPFEFVERPASIFRS